LLTGIFYGSRIGFEFESKRLKVHAVLSSTNFNVIWNCLQEQEIVDRPSFPTIEFEYQFVSALLFKSDDGIPKNTRNRWINFAVLLTVAYEPLFLVYRLQLSYLAWVTFLAYSFRCMETFISFPTLAWVIFLADNVDCTIIFISFPTLA
jgi:hypothetical protein